jgi:hypothetical protein
MIDLLDLVDMGSFVFKGISGYANSTLKRGMLS